MQLALRKTPPANATRWQRAMCWVIKARLVSQYSHGGVVINGWLHHITAATGYQKLAPGEWSPERWDITDMGGDDVAAASVFAKLSLPPKGVIKRLIWLLLKGYDWVSLMAFVGPLVRVVWLNYCFELVWWMRTGERPAGRITPEILLTL